MAVFDRVLANVIICGLKVTFIGSTKPSDIEGWQPFYNSLLVGADQQKLYASVGSVDFDEESANDDAGVYYTQKLTFRFPASDQYRAERIALLQKIKFVTISLTNGLDIVVGRNDYNQNTPPIVKVKTNEQLCSVEITSQSIFPSGYTPNPDAFGLPVFVPFSFE